MRRCREDAVRADYSRQEVVAESSFAEKTSTTEPSLAQGGVQCVYCIHRFLDALCDLRRRRRVRRHRHGNRPWAIRYRRDPLGPRHRRPLRAGDILDWGCPDSRRAARTRRSTAPIRDLVVPWRIRRRFGAWFSVSLKRSPGSAAPTYRGAGDLLHRFCERGKKGKRDVPLRDVPLRDWRGDGT